MSRLQPIRPRRLPEKPEHKVGGETRAHHCHALGCKAGCPPRHLMCPSHWTMVSPNLQSEVYRTAKARGPRADSTWADWWRAAHRAMAEVRFLERPDPKDQVQKWLDHQLDMADFLESRGRK